MHALKTSFRGNPNVGLYVFATETTCLVGPEVSDTDCEALGRVFEVPIHRATIAGTGLLGVFLAGNNRTVLVPSIATKRELDNLTKAGLQCAVIETDLTALGNNILVNDKGCLVSPEYSPAERTAISRALGMPVTPLAIGELPIIGSCCVATDAGCLAHRGITDAEAATVEATLGVPVGKGTLNLGNPYIKGGLAANARGFIVGDLSGGPEIVNAQDTLEGHP